MTRYIAAPVGCQPGWATPADAKSDGFRQNWWPNEAGADIYEVGQKVVVPDYTKLVKWVKANRKWMLGNIPESTALKRALKAAGIE